MNAATAITSDHASLWTRVRDWLERWTAVFAPEEILRDGLSRRFALRCCNWLWPLEATVRRLIVAAALALDLAMLAPASPKQRSPHPHAPAPTTRGAASFRTVSIRGAVASQATEAGVRATVRKEQHLPFPSDDLLRLGPPHPQRPRKLVIRRHSPLHRHGRIRPSDPDYLGGHGSWAEADYANSSKLLFGSPQDHEPPPVKPDNDLRRGLYFRIPLESEDSEWRRIEKEWERVLPAPGIAARINALAGVLASPEPHIHRLARRLAANHALAALLREAPPPLLRKPKYDRLTPQVEEDLPLLAHAATQPPDTS